MLPSPAKSVRAAAAAVVADVVNTAAAAVVAVGTVTNPAV
jgi:hypothetical protein